MAVETRPSEGPNNEGSFPQEKVYRTLQTSVFELFPGMANPEYKGKIDKFCRMDIEISAAIDDKGLRHHRMRICEPFDKQMAGSLFFTLVNQRGRKALKIKPDDDAEETEEQVALSRELVIELEKFRDISRPDALEEVASGLFSPARASSDFYSNPKFASGYDRLRKEQDPTADVSGFTGEIAELMRKSPNTWGTRNLAEAPDKDFMQKFRQIGASARKDILTQYMSRFDDKGKMEVIRRHMRVFNKSKELVIGEKDIAGFLKWPYPIISVCEGQWVVGDNNDFVRIERTEVGFTVVAQRANLLVADLAWSNNQGAGDPERRLEPVIGIPLEFERASARNREVLLRYRIPPENSSSLLGSIFLDHISNLRDGVRGGVDGGSIFEDCFLRRNIILNKELPRRIEKALAS